MSMYSRRIAPKALCAILTALVLSGCTVEGSVFTATPKQVRVSSARVDVGPHGARPVILPSSATTVYPPENQNKQ